MALTVAPLSEDPATAELGALGELEPHADEIERLTATAIHTCRDIRDNSARNVLRPNCGKTSTTAESGTLLITSLGTW